MDKSIVSPFLTNGVDMLCTAGARHVKVKIQSSMIRRAPVFLSARVSPLTLRTRYTLANLRFQSVQIIIKNNISLIQYLQYRISFNIIW